MTGSWHNSSPCRVAVALWRWSSERKSQEVDGGEHLSVAASNFSLASMSCLPYTAHIMIETECVVLFFASVDDLAYDVPLFDHAGYK